jgi:hypothetical protein
MLEKSDSASLTAGINVITGKMNKKNAGSQ